MGVFELGPFWARLTLLDGKGLCLLPSRALGPWPMLKSKTEPNYHMRHSHNAMSSNKNALYRKGREMIY